MWILWASLALAGEPEPWMDGFYGLWSVTTTERQAVAEQPAARSQRHTLWLFSAPVTCNDWKDEQAAAWAPPTTHTDPVAACRAKVEARLQEANFPRGRPGNRLELDVRPWRDGAPSEGRFQRDDVSLMITGVSVDLRPSVQALSEVDCTTATAEHNPIHAAEVQGLPDAYVLQDGTGTLVVQRIHKDGLVARFDGSVDADGEHRPASTPDVRFERCEVTRRVGPPAPVR